MDTSDLAKLSIDRGVPPPIGPRGARRTLAWIALLLVASAAALLAWHWLASSASVETASVTLAYPSQQVTVLSATGYVAPQRKASISSKATGRLEWLGVLEGSHVRQGEVIARLENRDVSAALGQAQANVRVARANLVQAQAELDDARNAYQRSSDLLARHFISQAANDTALARYNKARATVVGMEAAITAAQANARAAQVALDQTLIRAPFDGVILTKNANVGDNITPFSAAADTKGAVVTMADMDTLEVEADVSESSLSHIYVGQSAEIQLDAFPALRLSGVVARMVPTVDRSKATLTAKLRFIERDPRVLPDMSARVGFLSRALRPDERRPFLAMPAAALASRGARQVAYVVSNGRVHEAPVRTGRRLGELLEVAGLAPGDKVVLNPNGRLADGMAVENVSK
ncbi:efflux RND transporter periplasmic adaptor subunit [Massilia horti]|uniref:Efflux RND transporter periplasmic adaptor subunit n=1 Tax=Massilia horti TaxID=2562153 RepID=A0A4Y9SM27_9BURK|nr:efflux RND transporter periplasmic adaptor subunit [Massilia horti]TFW27598.1 efflux RND transporter periplasmic adaptor subunit [Massilia horti]